MTRAEYEKTYGVQPVVSPTSTIDTKPAPIRMTRAEYESIYGEPAKEETLPDQLINRYKQGAGGAIKAVTDTVTGQVPLSTGIKRFISRPLGAAGGAVGDIAGAAISAVVPDAIGEKLAEAVSPATDPLADAFKKLQDTNPELAQDLADIGNMTNLIGAGGATAPVASRMKPVLVNRAANKIERELYDIENNYAKTRTANEYSKDAGVASRKRIAATDVLAGSIDADGTIRTKLPGGAVERYRAQTIDGAENLVRNILIEEGAKVDLPTIERSLKLAVADSGLEGADLVAALNGIKKELAGLAYRADEKGLIDLSKVHDAKISTTNNINYQTPPETKTYRKAVARTYKTIIEKTSKHNIEQINGELSKYLGDIERLENLDGRKVKGGRLGKYFAQVSGNMIGAAAGGAVGGPVGMALGTIAGGEAAGFLKSQTMARGFGGTAGRTAPKNAILEKARLKIPDKAVIAPEGVEKTKEITKTEKAIAKNVADQREAIKKGDFTQVSALKEVYTALVETLKDEISHSKSLGKRKTQYANTATTNKNDIE